MEGMEVMGNSKTIQLEDFEFRKIMMDAVPEIRVEGVLKYKSSHHKKKKERFLLGLVMRSLLRTFPHKYGHLQDCFTCKELTRGLGRDYKEIPEASIPIQ